LTFVVGAGAVGSITWFASSMSAETEALSHVTDTGVPATTDAADTPVQLPPIAPAPPPPPAALVPVPPPSTTATPTTTSAPTTKRQPATTSKKPTSTRTTAPVSPRTPQQDTSYQNQVLELVNEARADAGCSPVSPDSRLTQAAGGHSADMSNRDYFSHTTPEGETFSDRIKKAGYPSPGAENIARGQTDAQNVMDQWMNSSGHRKNILNCSMTTMGVGVDTDGWYWTQDFGY
jgi:uncharacterized protein YkwD